LNRFWIEADQKAGANPAVLWGSLEVSVWAVVVVATGAWWVPLGIEACHGDGVG
jgi:hypothetical protein